MSTTHKNFIGKIVKDSGDFYPLLHNKRKVGSEVLIHMYDDGKVLVYAPYDKKLKLGNMDAVIDLTDAKKYITCTAATLIDVHGDWKEMMNNRYFH